jgi:hypothetical protein
MGVFKKRVRSLGPILVFTRNQLIPAGEARQLSCCIAGTGLRF